MAAGKKFIKPTTIWLSTYLLKKTIENSKKTHVRIDIMYEEDKKKVYVDGQGVPDYEVK